MIPPLRLKRGKLARILALGLRPGEPAVALDDPERPKLLVGDATGTPREVGGGGAAARDVTVTASGPTGTVALGQVFVLLSETASAPGRLRLYRTEAARSADAERPIVVDPHPSAGVIVDDHFVAPSVVDGPDVPSHGGPDGLCYWAWSGATPAVLTFRVIALEA